jgi:hypothetical protein
MYDACICVDPAAEAKRSDSGSLAVREVDASFGLS